jgi:hypothetical protein
VLLKLLTDQLLLPDTSSALGSTEEKEKNFVRDFANGL